MSHATRRLRVPFALVTLALGALALPASAADGDGVKSKVKIVEGSYDPDTDTRTYIVKVRARGSKCDGDRKVRVFERILGNDPKHASGETDDEGLATLTEDSPDDFAGENYYAKVSRSTVGQTKCKADTSPDKVLGLPPCVVCRAPARAAD